MIQFTIYGIPKARQTARNFRTKSGIPVTVDPKHNKEGKAYYRTVAVKHKPECPLDGALKLTAKFYFPVPKSFPKWKKEVAENELLLHTIKPDLSNLFKLLEDAFKGILWTDDSRIALYGPGTGKYYSKNPRIEVTVEEIIQAKPDKITLKNQMQLV